MIGNGKEVLDEKGLEEKVLEDVAMATGERDTITTGEGCYGDGVRVVMPNLLFCIHQWDSEGVCRCEWECRGLGRS